MKSRVTDEWIQAIRSVIAEGEDHFETFLNIQEWLSSHSESDYLRAVAPPPASLVATAKEFMGLHYLWGGLSAWGYDCSGLTWAVYRVHGITIPRDADAQFASGTPVSLAKMQPGDLLFYEHPVVGHVAMYIGDGKMIESPNSASAVRIVPVRTSDFRGVRRFF